MPEQSGPVPSPGVLRVRLRFSPLLRGVLLDLIQRVDNARAAAPEEITPPSGLPDEPPDPDLQAAWADSLRERAGFDTDALQALAANPQFGQADLPVAPPAAEALARASVQVRLHLRETLLRDLTTPEAQGEIDVFRLPPAEQQGYACFRLLAHLEEDLIQQLDPGARPA